MKFDLYAPLLRLLSAAAFPVFCSLCGRNVPEGMPVCRGCKEKLLQKAAARMLFSPEKDWCGVCGRQLVSADELCPDCRDSRDFVCLDKICALFPYSPEHSGMLSAWKMKGERLYSRIFAEIVAAVLRSNSVCGAGISPADIAVVPVPPRPGKIRAVGWDQVKELCGILKRVWRVPVSDCLVRTTKIQQKRLGRLARKTNMKGHILMKRNHTPPRVSVIVDDIVTTGATLENCAEVLKSVGCGTAVGLTLFYD